MPPPRRISRSGLVFRAAVALLRRQDLRLFRVDLDVDANTGAPEAPTASWSRPCSCLVCRRPQSKSLCDLAYSQAKGQRLWSFSSRRNPNRASAQPYVARLRLLRREETSSTPSNIVPGLARTVQGFSMISLPSRVNPLTSLSASRCSAVHPIECAITQLPGQTEAHRRQRGWTRPARPGAIDQLCRAIGKPINANAALEQLQGRLDAVMAETRIETGSAPRLPSRQHPAEKLQPDDLRRACSTKCSTAQGQQTLLAPTGMRAALAIFDSRPRTGATRAFECCPH